MDLVHSKGNISSDKLSIIPAGVDLELFQPTDKELARREINIDKDLKVIVVRTSRKTNYEEKLKRKITASGCAVGTIFGDVYDAVSYTHLTLPTKRIV